MSQNHGFCHFFDTLDDDHLRKMKKSGPQNMTNIENQVILRKFLHKYKPVTPSYPRRKSADFAGRRTHGRTHGRTDARTDEHQISEASYTKSPFGANITQDGYQALNN